MATPELRKVTHRTIDEVTRLVEAYRLNVAVARLMELVSATRRAIDSGPGAGDPAVREAAETLAVLLSLFAPYTAEECWELLGHQPSVAQAGWPVADPALLVQDQVTCVVQVNGKVRDRLEVPPGITEDDLRELALAAPGVARALAGARGADGYRAAPAAGQRRSRLIAPLRQRRPPPCAWRPSVTVPERPSCQTRRAARPRRGRGWSPRRRGSGCRRGCAASARRGRRTA